MHSTLEDQSTSLTAETETDVDLSRTWNDFNSAAPQPERSTRLTLGRRVGAFWNRAVALPLRRLMENIVFRRDLERLYLTIGGHIFFQTLSAAVQLDLFSRIERSGCITRADIAQELGLENQPVRILLLGCTALGLLKKRGDRYYNTRLSRKYFVRSSSQSLCAFVELEQFIIYRAMYSFCDAIRENRNVGLNEFQGDEPTLYQRLARYPELETIFQESMRELSVQANADLARYVDFSWFRHVVDVGGGDGTNLIELVRHWPHLRGTVFDSPSVCEIARRNIAASGFADRVAAAPGDCFQTPFPKDADGLLFAHFFTIWSPDKDRCLLQKAFDSLPAGGSIILFNMMQHNNESGPLTAAIGSPYFLTLATGQGMLYTWDEYRQWMHDAGFRNIRTKALPKDHGVVIGTKP